MSLKILLIDDDAYQRKIVNDALEIFLKQRDFDIKIEESDNFDDGITKLNNSQFDAAIIDLRLSNNEKEAKGNLFIKEILDRLRFPIRIVSSHLGDLDEDFRTPSFFFNYYTRDAVDFEIIFNEFIDIYETGITQILNYRGRIDSDITNIFWKHISFILPEFIKQKKKNTSWDVEKVLLRYISAHILEYLELNIDNNLEPVNSIEFYIKPSVKGKIFTGDILKKKSDNSYWVIVTPVCDLATDNKRKNPKAEFVSLVRIQDIDSIIAGKNSGEKGKLFSNSLDLKYHFLPKSILFEGGFINFQILNSYRTDEISEEFDIELIISSLFRKDVVSRFANYYSRQGQPLFE